MSPNTSLNAKKIDPNDVGVLILLRCGLFAFFVVGIIFIGVGWNAMQLPRQVGSWPTTKATVLESKIVSELREEGGPENRRHVNIFSVELEYQYQLNGSIYTGDRISFISKTSRDEKKMQPVLDKYAAGKTVNTYYNPKDFDDSYLEPGNPWFAVPFLIGGTLLSLFCAVAFFKARPA